MSHPSLPFLHTNIPMGHGGNVGIPNGQAAQTEALVDRHLISHLSLRLASLSVGFGCVTASRIPHAPHHFLAPVAVRLAYAKMPPWICRNSDAYRGPAEARLIISGEIQDLMLPRPRVKSDSWTTFQSLERAVLRTGRLAESIAAASVSVGFQTRIRHGGKADFTITDLMPEWQRKALPTRHNHITQVHASALGHEGLEPYTQHLTLRKSLLSR